MHLLRAPLLSPPASCLQVWLDRNQWRGLLMLIDNNGAAYFPLMLQLPVPVLMQTLGLDPQRWVGMEARARVCVHQHTRGVRMQYACALLPRKGATGRGLQGWGLGRPGGAM